MQIRLSISTGVIKEAGAWRSLKYENKFFHFWYSRKGYREAVDACTFEYRKVFVCKVTPIKYTQA